MGIEDALEEPGFWILGVGGVAMVLIGFIVSKKMEYSLPVWQLLVLIVGIIVAAAFFATKD